MMLGAREPKFCMPGTLESLSKEGSNVTLEGERSRNGSD